MWALPLCGMIVLISLLRWRRSRLPPFEFYALWLMRFYARLYHGLSIRQATLLPPRGPGIVISNHTCSADPAFLQACARRKMSFLVAEEYFRIPVVSRIFRYTQCISVARHGQDVTAVRVALRRLGESRLLCLFPEGSLSGAGRGRLRTGRRGAALLALRSGAPVYPVFIVGGPQHTNVPRAWLFPSRRGIIFGPPIYLKDYVGRRIDRKLIEEVGALLMAQLVALDPSTPSPFRKARPIPGGNKDDRKRRRVTREALRAL